MDCGCRRHHDLRADCFCTGDQAQGTFNGERADQTHSHDTPEQDIDPLRSFSEQESKSKHNQNKPACCDTHVDDLQKEFRHG